MASDEIDLDAYTFTNARPQGPDDGEYEIPQVNDGLYPAVIGGVKAKEFPDYENPDVMIPKYIVTWLLDTGGEEPAELAQFVKVPLGLIRHGYVSDKSNLHPFMKAIGLDPDAPAFRVDPREWVGREAQVLVENVTLQRGKNAGQTRPQITKVLRKGGEPAKTAPVAAQEGQHAEWNALQAAMRPLGLLKGDMENVMGGDGSFTEAHLIVWLTENQPKGVADLCSDALVRKAQAKAVYAATT